MKVNDIILNKYIITKIISGDGTNRRGMSNLYKARDKDLGIYWAIKEIIKNSDGTISLQQRSLIREAQIMRKLQHPSIPRIVSIEQLDDRVLIIMDWADGRSVGEWIRSSGAMPLQRGLNIIKTVCGVVGYLHSRPTPIFYRDMKPENIMYDPSSKRVMLLDFGISVEVDFSKPITDRVGTKGYYDKYSIAPTKRELANGVGPRYFDLRSDIYSLGWTIFEIFTGVSPYNYILLKSRKVETVILSLLESRLPEFEDEDSENPELKEKTWSKFSGSLSKSLRHSLEELVTGGDIDVFISKAIKIIKSEVSVFVPDENIVNNCMTGLDKELQKAIHSLGNTYIATRDVREYAKNIPQSLADVIIKATEPEPIDRFQSIEELQIALEDLEKVDKGYNKLLKRRVNQVITLGALGIGLCLGSIAPYMAYEQGLKNQYQVLVANASKSGSFSDYLKVIEYDPKEIDPYFGLIDSIKADGVFTKDEESTMLDLINPNLPTLEKSKRYKELAFEIGRLYWLYYDGGKSEEIASRWFKDAKGYNQLADVFYSIGSFPTAVVKSANEGSDAGMYKKQWEILNSVTGQSELTSLQIAKAQLYLVNTYTSRLRSDGVSKEDIQSKLSEISSLVNSSSSGDSRQSRLANELKKSLPEVLEKVEVAYSV